MPILDVPQLSPILLETILDLGLISKETSKSYYASIVLAASIGQYAGYIIKSALTLVQVFVFRTPSEHASCGLFVYIDCLTRQYVQNKAMNSSGPCGSLSEYTLPFFQQHFTSLNFLGIVYH